jgi:hypothetical protein
VLADFRTLPLIAAAEKLALTFGGPPVSMVGRRPCRCSLFVRRSPGSRAAVGRRVSDLEATLDAGEDGRMMGDEDDVHWLVMAISVEAASDQGHD